MRLLVTKWCPSLSPDLTDRTTPDLLVASCLLPNLRYVTAGALLLRTAGPAVHASHRPTHTHTKSSVFLCSVSGEPELLTPCGCLGSGRLQSRQGLTYPSWYHCQPITCLLGQGQMPSLGKPYYQEGKKLS